MLAINYDLREFLPRAAASLAAAKFRDCNLLMRTKAKGPPAPAPRANQFTPASAAEEPGKPGTAESNPMATKTLTIKKGFNFWWAELSKARRPATANTVPLGRLAPSGVSSRKKANARAAATSAARNKIPGLGFFVSVASEVACGADSVALEVRT